ncbi:hypothetical protein BEP19_14760 [Ammoniphilus oxalaticus]|uniref:Uncharacterized protein n=1 Tax=Ammoniphilus oxalaticus TaxID=66863 RepID=A0A419SE49_9BACL|nr:hypothetical protein [Ammoniphilus oxalaticus]RKD21480.1 hypothetical protein BEP19_14760 [Ammoniphilus oxalaticus]
MKYSIRGNLNTDDGSRLIVDTINSYELWKLDQRQIEDEDNNEEVFSFEVWLNDSADRLFLFDELRSYVDLFGGKIDWHECTHDEAEPQPCVIVGTYEVV